MIQYLRLCHGNVLCFEGSKINIEETVREKKKTCVKSYSQIYFYKSLKYEGVVWSLCAKILLKDLMEG